jgi:uncharacterized membrane protein YagU involved in acid resistance
MKSQEVVADIGTGLVGGLIGTAVMDAVGTKLYEWEPEEIRQQEEAVRPGLPYEIAAEKAADALGLELSEQQVKVTGLVGVHFGLGVGWGPLYVLLRRMTGLHPVLAGVLTGASMSVIVDEGLTPALGLSAPNRDYPLFTHIRGFANHVIYGLSVAAGVELLTWLARRRISAH